MPSRLVEAPGPIKADSKGIPAGCCGATYSGFNILGALLKNCNLIGEADRNVSEFDLCRDLPVLDSSLSLDNDVRYISEFPLPPFPVPSRFIFVGEAKKCCRLFPLFPWPPLRGSSRPKATGESLGDNCSGLNGGEFI